MSMPNPFEMGKAIGGNISGGIREGAETSALDQILQQAVQSDDPQQVDNMMNQILLRVSPEKRPIVEQAMKNRKEQLINQNTQREMYRLGDLIEVQNPGSSLHKTLADVYRSNIPMDQKEKVIKSLSESIPYKFEQHQRLTKDSILKRFSYRIKEANDNIKNARYDEKDKFRKIRDALVKERDKELDFASLRETLDESAKPVFDPNIPAHKEEAIQLYAKHKDKKIVEEELRKKYEF